MEFKVTEGQTSLTIGELAEAVKEKALELLFDEMQKMFKNRGAPALLTRDEYERLKAQLEV